MNIEDFNRKEIGKRLKLVRRTIDYTQMELGKLCGLPHSNISEIESGKRKIQAQYLFLLASKFKVNLNWVFTGAGAMFSYIDLKWDLGQDNEIVKELIYLLENSPSLRYTILTYFLELKEIKKDVIENVLSTMKGDKPITR